MIIVTTPSIDGKTVKKYLGIVAGEGLIGANVYQDIFSGIRDVVGGKTSSSVSKKTYAVIVGENPGSKYEKAQSLNIPICSEDDLLEKFNS